MRDAVDEQIADLADWLGLVEERATLGEITDDKTRDQPSH